MHTLKTTALGTMIIIFNNNIKDDVFQQMYAAYCVQSGRSQ